MTISTIRLEASSYCQLRCPSCPTTTGEIDEAVGKGFLSLENFKRLIDDNPKLKLIELSNFGEIFLNPEIQSIMQYAFEKRVALSAKNGVNLNHVKDEVLEDLVRYKFWGMTLSIDGASQETYVQYRKRGNFDVVMANVKKIIALKKKYKTRYPELTWQFVVFGHNEHEIPIAKEMAKQLNIPLKLKLTWDEEVSPLRDPQFVRNELDEGAVSRTEFEDRHKKHYMSGVCSQLWLSPMINWNGDVLGCCKNHWGTFGGNAFTQGLTKALDAEPINYAKAMLQGKVPERKDIPCSSCEVFGTMKKFNNFVRVSTK